MREASGWAEFVEVIDQVTLPDLGNSRLWAHAKQHPVTAPDGTPTRLARSVRRTPRRTITSTDIVNFGQGEMAMISTFFEAKPNKSNHRSPAFPV